ncbi:phage tail protein, partial [Kingella kingae]|nr:phage tail tape measure protein [Kingella kingae]MDK4541884.1 phage tail tape measure protein [Kingella kingae]
KDGIAPIMPLLEMIGAGWQGLYDLAIAFLSPIIMWFQELGLVSDSTAQKAQGFGYYVGAMLGSLFGSVITIGQMIISGWQMIFDGVFSLVSSLCETIKAVWNGGLTGILALIMSWSPLASFVAVFSGLFAWFAGLPATFAAYGGMMIDGLVNGIKSKIGAAVGAVQSLATRIKGAFTSPKSMDIHSPSRVFRSYGGYITEGLALGVNSGAAQPLNRIGQLAGSLKERFAGRMRGFNSDLSARLSANADTLTQARSTAVAQSTANANSAITIHFNPTINAQGGNLQQIETALQMSLREFEELFKRMMADKARRAY